MEDINFGFWFYLRDKLLEVKLQFNRIYIVRCSWTLELCIYIYISSMKHNTDGKFPGIFITKLSKLLLGSRWYPNTTQAFWSVSFWKLALKSLPYSSCFKGWHHLNWVSVKLQHQHPPSTRYSNISIAGKSTSILWFQEDTCTFLRLAS